MRGREGAEAKQPTRSKQARNDVESAQDGCVAAVSARACCPAASMVSWMAGRPEFAVTDSPLTSFLFLYSRYGGDSSNSKSSRMSSLRFSAGGREGVRAGLRELG